MHPSPPMVTPHTVRPASPQLILLSGDGLNAEHCTVVKVSKEHGSVGVSSLILAHIGSQALTIDNNLN